jgi:tetratricopeptide (TPR) repeat protein
MRIRFELAILCVSVSCLTCGCRRAPKDLEARFLQKGRGFLATKDYSRAALEFSNAIRATPRDPEAYYQLGLAYLGAGASSQATASFLRATELGAGHTGAQVSLAALLVRDPDPANIAEGARRASDMLQLWPDNAEAADTLAVAQFRLGNLDDAERQIRKVLSKYPANLLPAITLSGMKLARRDFEGAEAVLKEMAANSPNSADVAVALGNLYSVLERWPEAEAQFRKAISVDARNGHALLGVAAARLRAGRKEEAEAAYRQASALPDPRYRHVHASYLIAERNYDAGIKELAALAKTNPNDLAARARLLDAYTQAGRLAEAESVVSAALKSNPGDADALARRSMIQVAAGKLVEAEATLNGLLKKRRAAPTAHYLLSRIYRMRGDALRERVELIQALEENPAMLPARTSLAAALLGAGAPAAALESLDAAPESQRGALTLLTARGIALIALGRTAEARQTVNQALTAGRTPDLLAQDALLKMLKRDYAAARAAAAEALLKDPADVRALRIVAQSYTSEGRPEEGLKMLEQHSAEYADSAVVQNYAGEALADAGRPQQARAHFEAANRADPKLFAPVLALVRLDLAKGEAASAAQRLIAFLALDPVNSAAHVWLGIIETKTGARASAISRYRKALELSPDHVIALNNLAYLLAESGNAQEALSFAEKARDLEPENADVIGTLGWVMYRRGLYDLAVKILEEAVRRDASTAGRNAGSRRFHLAMAYTKTGDLARGQKTLDEALKLNGDTADAAAAREVIGLPPRPATP